MLIKDAHASLAPFCNENAGLGISLDLIRRLILQQILSLERRYTRMDANQQFRDLKVSFSGIFNTNNLKLKIDNRHNPNDFNEFYPGLEIEDLDMTIVGFLEDLKVVEIEITYTKILGRIFLDVRELTATMVNEKHTEKSFKRIWETDSAVRQNFELNHQFDQQAWEDLTVYFKGTSIFGGSSIAESFIDSLVFPDIFGIFNGIKFGDKGTLSANPNGDLLMFTANSLIDTSVCPTYNASGQTMTQTTVISGSTPETVTVEVGIDPTSNTTQYPIRNNEGSGPERIRTADVFLFTPIQLLEVNFKQVKPSVTASDKGKVGPVRWRYSVTAALTSFHLKLIDPWPIEFEMSLPFEITGQAAAGVKIGCINYEAVGAMFHGDVDPFKIRFKIELDWRSRQIVFVSKIHDIKAHGFQFSTFPQMDFPLTQILDYILARAAEFVVSKQADRILNITRIPIADLRIMEKIAEIVPNALAGETDTKGNATMGLKFKV